MQVGCIPYEVSTPHLPKTSNHPFNSYGPLTKQNLVKLLNTLK